MKKNPLRRGALAALTTAVLLLGSTLAAAPAQAEPGDQLGELVINLVDDQGRPVAGSVMGSPTNGSYPFTLPESSGSGPGTMLSSYRIELPVGSYGLMAAAPWGGLLCAGVTPCVQPGFGGGVTPTPPTVTGAVTITDDGPAAVHTFRFPVPVTMSGTPRVGGVLTATVSAAQRALLAGFVNVPGLGNVMGEPEFQWRRDGAPVHGATQTTYQLTPQDAGRKIDVVVKYPAMLRLFLSSLSGGGWTVTDYTVPGVSVGKAVTRTTADLLRKRIYAGRGANVRIDVTAGRTPVTGGKVRLTIGKRKMSKVVRNGSARVALPRSLKPGRYKIAVRYLGTTTHQPSKARNLKLRVVRK